VDQAVPIFPLNPWPRREQEGSKCKTLRRDPERRLLFALSRKEMAFWVEGVRARGTGGSLEIGAVALDGLRLHEQLLDWMVSIMGHL
jgi:hypothetical protein